MHITFIRPNLGDFRGTDAMEPMVFALLASRTPPGVEIAFHDERLAPVPLDLETDLVAMTVETYTARRAYQIASHYRRRGVPVVMGGYHPTLLADEAARYCDAIVIGDAEGVWERIVEDAMARRLARVYRQDADTAIDGLRPDRSIFRGKRYAPLSLVQYGRGCRLACDFCSIHAFYKRRMVQRPVADVVAELETLPRKRPVFFVDDNLFSDVPTLTRLLEAITPLRMRWTCQITIDVARNDKLLALMARSGCLLALVGFESLSEANLGQIGKKWNLRRGDYTKGIRKLHDHGILIYGTFVFGYDDDGPDAFDRTVEFAVESGFCIANFNPLTPTPGTALMQRLQDEGRLLHERWWLDPRFRYGDATFVPRGMTPEQLTQGCWRARQSFYSYSSMARRICTEPALYARPTRLGTLLASNLISRREIRRKQGSPLGTEEALRPMEVVA
ncbi:MAG: B12-binding domain-containing radical SAM protein [Burkholderiales bacterium]